MAECIISLKDVTIAFGAESILENATVSVLSGMRAALTGRNGSGKSTLLKIMAGMIHPDSGLVTRAQKSKVVYVPQDVPADREGDEEFNSLSGGRRRRKILEEAIISGADLLLLDEPTNHLDIEAIDWLSSSLKRLRNAAVLFVTHDRRFLAETATSIFDLDRGVLSGWDCGYKEFLRRKEELLSDEAVIWEKKTKLLAKEEAWLRRGVKARTTRNEGRVAALMKLRKEFAERRMSQGSASLKIDSASQSGVSVLKIEDLSFSYDGKKDIVKNFTSTVLRGEKIGVIGLNGSGKSTFLKLLTGNLTPSNGKITVGTNVEVVYFDQMREEVDLEATVAENVARDRNEVVIGGVSKHVYSYLADFLFTPERARTPAKALSGGERARLAFAKLFLKSANLIILDEPTNDLDIETLELLEEQLLAYSGTLLLVSHDREFMDRVVTSVFALEGDGEIVVSAGGYDDYERFKKARASQSQAKVKEIEKPQQKDVVQKRKLSYKEQRELETLEKEIEELETKISSILSSPDTTDRDSYAIVPSLQARLDEAIERWSELESKKDA
jgi:ATP-binding cassette subfamily F protein uup